MGLLARLFGPRPQYRIRLYGDGYMVDKRDSVLGLWPKEFCRDLDEAHQAIHKMAAEAQERAAKRQLDKARNRTFDYRFDRLGTRL